MLCRAKVSLQDWPEGQAREVDPSHERIQGWLMVGYIVPLQLPRRPAEQPDAAPVAKKRARGTRDE